MGEAYHQHFAETHPDHYNAYRIGCGRDATLRVVWGGR
jgi:peptide-methionine (S)-S-oxide reductase